MDTCYWQISMTFSFCVLPCLCKWLLATRLASNAHPLFLGAFRVDSTIGAMVQKVARDYMFGGISILVSHWDVT